MDVFIIPSGRKIESFVCSAEFGYSRPTDNSITLRLEWLHICHVYHEESRSYGELMDLQRYQLSQDVQAQQLELRRLTSCKKSANDGCRSSKQHSTDTLPVPTDDMIFQSSYEPFGRNRSLSSAPHISRSASNQTRHGSLYNTTVGNSVATPYMSENQNRRAPKIRTPPVLINGNPHNGTSDVDGGSQLSASSNWRRHSSCLEDVASGAQRTRRRLPSPPQDVQAQQLELRRLTSCKKSANDGCRSSKQHSTDTLPVPTDDMIFQSSYEPFGRNRSLSSAPHISRSASNQTRHGSLYNTTVGNSVATPYMSENQNRRAPKIRTPPVLINGNPHNGTSDVDGGSQLSASSNWRRHSSCLEDVASGAQRTRRRLPSPPSSPLNAQNKDGHLSVELYASGSFCSSPRLNVRGNSGLNDT
ncbi:hypothetical protein AHF37_07135 [Paragonimus kellicotti]|nr:hypothetical protein AHF37_07135 [Paragonimus kellicotti]